MPPAAERTYERPSAYPGGEEGVEGVVREVMVIRSVTIYVWNHGQGGAGNTREGTYALVKRLALADEHDVTFYEVGI